MRVFITGITGFVGSELGEHFRSLGHEVRGSSTRARAARGEEAPVVHRLGEPIDPAWLAEVDVLVHAAWDLSLGSSAINVSGSSSWRAAAARSGSHAVFVSSYGAYADFPTRYGRDKAAVEAAFAGATACVVRPALVVGGGGLFAQLVAAVRRCHVLPLPDGGRHGVDLIDVSELCQAVGVLASRRRDGSHDLSAGRLTLRALCEGIARALGRAPRPVLEVPVAPLRRVLDALARRGIELGVRERLLGHLENARRPRPSTLAELLGRAPRGALESIVTHAPGASGHG